MRIVQLANFYGARSGGLRTAIDRWGAGYVSAGHEVVLVVPGQERDEEVLPSGVVRITVPAPRIPCSGGYRLASARRVADVLGYLRPDSIEVSDRLTLRGFGRWARRRDVHATMVSHERFDRLLGQVMPDAAARRLADRANADIARSFDTVVCTTGFAAAEFERVGAGNLVRAPLGVDLDVFDPRHLDPDLTTRWTGGTGTLIAHCGRLSVEKRVDRSITAVGRLHRKGVPAHLVVAGDGPMRGPLHSVARGLPVTFLGHLSDRHQVASLLASADISLAPGPHETFCLSALESLAAGTPVVGSRSSAVAGLVDDTCGALSENSGAGFADAIEQVLTLPQADREHAARARALQYRWPDSVARMLKVHGALMAG
ncbi:glycosyltransferase [Gordonia sp. ABSL49_1]|uniref:glycosyltransferase n=1 Tax=unclassified Gordonia (in: high G+C Gram-positive bacteria) TaxID=2657482 RepID=UPI001F0E2A32|nr:glycosyltransferase [Gordonia sp. ABSL49_1]MCH5645436.1 glycosyltransferase [Gordonia sp. ABSL49_1]